MIKALKQWHCYKRPKEGLGDCSRLKETKEMLRDKNWMQCTIPDWSFSDSNKYYQGHNLEIWGIWIWVYIRPGVNKLFYKGPDNKCFRLCGSDILSQFFKSALVGQGRHRQYISIKCYLQKKKNPRGPDLACKLYFADPC